MNRCDTKLSDTVEFRRCTSPIARICANFGCRFGACEDIDDASRTSFVRHRRRVVDVSTALPKRCARTAWRASLHRIGAADRCVSAIATTTASSGCVRSLNSERGVDRSPSDVRERVASRSAHSKVGARSMSSASRRTVQKKTALVSGRSAVMKKTGLRCHGSSRRLRRDDSAAGRATGDQCSSSSSSSA